MSAMAATAPKLDIDDLVSAFATSHIGQHHIDIAAIRDQLAQLLYAHPQQAAAIVSQAQAAASKEPRKRCPSLASNLVLETEDMAMDLDGAPSQQQQQLFAPPPNSPQRMHPAEHPFAGQAHMQTQFQPGLPAEPAPAPPSSPVQATPFFDRAQRGVAAPF
ncbi:hypothetical protein EXIGLDRAFT_827757 [Exidia glandulosa HHB12029]|uniref:Uncharacterized protein n=1 Tax=Exidia glandulosa HHB12029 TaxID=1314781 RepID=A0A165QLV1_EXIGL|nr:hypothetical protein EXIGLDRAFT_827757 [Exidia glandulosa HHB12029]